ncbi:MAG: hypothetical protein AB7Q97_14505 [Gammaproteobacteria bacterium]
MSIDGIRAAAVAFMASCVFSVVPKAPAREAGEVRIPQSGHFRPEDAGVRARTHHRMYEIAGGQARFNARIAAAARSAGLPPVADTGFQTPASIACIYRVTRKTGTCNPNAITAVPSGGGGAIAIVVAFDYPFAQADLDQFSAQFSLPPADLTVVYANGTRPNASPNDWEIEAALDLQWAHAMAPDARLYLVEAAGSSIGNLMVAVRRATALVQAAGGGQVSMSWGSGEFAGQAAFEPDFNQANVVFIASSGDSAGASWPCVSPNVICVGGTTLRASAGGDFIQEVAWADGGGGLSTLFPAPAYQFDASGASLTGSTQRGVPDVALAADPTTPGWVYYTPSNTGAGGWYAAGGTSWSAPTFAGMENLAATAAGGGFAPSSVAELQRIYARLGTTSFKDIRVGWCGTHYGQKARKAWDQCTGVGSKRGGSR